MPQTPLSLATVPSRLSKACCIPDHFAQVDPCIRSSLPKTLLSFASVSQTPTQTRCFPDHFAQVDPCLNLNVTLSLRSPSEVLIASNGPQTPTRTRPNSSLQFPHLSNIPLPSKANVLNLQGIATLPHHYPNQRFVDTLVSIALNGVTRVADRSKRSGLRLQSEPMTDEKESQKFVDRPAYRRNHNVLTDLTDSGKRLCRCRPKRKWQFGNTSPTLTEDQSVM